MTTKGHCESSLGSFDECSAAHKRLSTLRPSHLGCESACRQLSSTTTIAIYYYHSARKLILIYRPTEGRRPSWPITVTVDLCPWMHNASSFPVWIQNTLIYQLQLRFVCFLTKFGLKATEFHFSISENLFISIAFISKCWSNNGLDHRRSSY